MDNYEPTPTASRPWRDDQTSLGGCVGSGSSGSAAGITAGAPVRKPTLREHLRKLFAGIAIIAPGEDDEDWWDVTLGATPTRYSPDMSPAVVRYELPHDFFRSALSPYEAWVEERLGVSFSDAVILEAELPIEPFFCGQALPGVALQKNAASSAVAAAAVVDWQIPTGEAPIVSVKPVEFIDGDGSHVLWNADWGQTPVAIWFAGIEKPVIFFRLQHIDYHRSISNETTTLVAVRKQDLAGLLNLLGGLMLKQKKGKTIFVVNGANETLTVPRGGWDSVVLDPSITRLLRSDFETFLQRREWFKENDMPFRRGYLLHGPPGNGKTSVVRVMASHPGISIAAINWGDADADDAALSSLFTWAVEHGPTIIVMEDLDRHFSSESGHRPKHRISLAHFLNCLDGIATSDGVIVVATANNPHALDPAILSRPGRFDRVVEFKPPSEALRAEYIRGKIRGAVSEEETFAMARRSAGFSFAQLREAYIHAGQLAYEADSVVSGAEFAKAIDVMLPNSDSATGGRFRKRSVGFTSAGIAFPIATPDPEAPRIAAETHTREVAP